MDSLRDLFPDLNEEELKLAKERIEDYLSFTVRLYDNIRADPERYAHFKELSKQRREEREKNSRG